MTVDRSLHSLVDEVIAHSFDNHVALPWSQGLVVEADNKSLGRLLYGDTTRALHAMTLKKHVA